MKTLDSIADGMLGDVNGNAAVLTKTGACCTRSAHHRQRIDAHRDIAFLRGTVDGVVVVPERDFYIVGIRRKAGKSMIDGC